MKYKISQYAKKHNVTSRTIWNWIKKGELEIERTKTGRILVLDGMKDKDAPLVVATYARVSSSQNKNNLKTQQDRLNNYCAAKGYIVKKSITEIGSGLNDTRPKLEQLILDNDIDIIVVEHKDRLARFGMNYIIKLLNANNRKIEIINETDIDQYDLMEDFVSIITSFTARLYGKRRSKRKTEKIIDELNKNNDKI
jgi:predicted site-specific integrase-resolvase